MGNSDPGELLTPGPVVTAAHSDDTRRAGRLRLDWRLGAIHALRPG
jgi:hypothetical protein